MRTSIFNGENLREIFDNIEDGKKTVEETATYYGVSVGAMRNYLQAKNAYKDGRKVNATNVSTTAFTQWAEKYGGKGTPDYRRDESGRKHVKKAVQQEFDLPVPHVDPQKDQMEKDAEEARNEVVTENRPSDSDIVEHIGNVAMEAIKSLMIIYEGRHK